MFCKKKKKMFLYSSACGQENQTFSGVLEFINSENNTKSRKKNEKVLVVVYKTTANHFAVIYPFWGLECSRKPIFSINLNSSKVEKSALNPEKEFSIVSSREGVSFLFRTIDLIGKSKEKYTSNDWIEALSNTNKNSAFLKSTANYKSKQIQLNLSVLNEDNEEND